MQTVPLQAVPSQILTVPLGGQTVTLRVFQRTTGLYMDIYVAGGLIVAGVLCLSLNRIVRDAYLGFVGDLVFEPVVAGSGDPDWTGLSVRWLLRYLEPGELI